MHDLASVHWDGVLILLPLAGAMLAYLFPGAGNRVGILTGIALLGAVLAHASVVSSEGVQQHLVGGWPAPLGIVLRSDGLSLFMLLTTSAVGLGVSVYAAAWFRDEPGKRERFWPLWLLLLTALNALFLSADLFNLYVTLELLGLSAVALAAVAGGDAAYGAAMRYLLISLVGSLLYLLGVALIYHATGSVDIPLVAQRLPASAASWTAIALMVAGLLLKTALFPLHFWLPPAHANAGAPVSAVLSGLVVKATFYLLLRLWLELFGPLAPSLDLLFGLLGAAAVLWGSMQALRQSRLKLLIAYSTIAQIGYLFMAFPLAAAAGMTAWYGALYLVLSHALAKSAMFMAAGNLRMHGGHDRIAELDLVAQRLPLSVAAFALAGMSIMGLPPSGGFIAKWWLLQAALGERLWGMALVLVLGGLMSAAYIFKVVGYAFTRAKGPHEACRVPLSMEWAALALALLSVLLGLFVLPPLEMLTLGEPFSASGGGQ